jgi:YHS domain-containing protein
VTRLILVGILLFVIAWIFWRVVDGIIDGLGGTSRRRGRMPATKLVRDPVCGTWVVPRDSLSLTTGRQTHYFCSEACRGQFKGRGQRRGDSTP